MVRLDFSFNNNYTCKNFSILIGRERCNFSFITSAEICNTRANDKFQNFEAWFKYIFQVTTGNQMPAPDSLFIAQFNIHYLSSDSLFSSRFIIRYSAPDHYSLYYSFFRSRFIILYSARYSLFSFRFHIRGNSLLIIQFIICMPKISKNL